MSMTKKDYSAIAEQFAKEREHLDSRDELSPTTRAFMQAELDSISKRLACVFYAQNPRFKVATFLSAAGMRTDLLLDATETVSQSRGFFGVSVP
jgi:hypothetical protein